MGKNNTTQPINKTLPQKNIEVKLSKVPVQPKPPVQKVLIDTKKNTNNSSVQIHSNEVTPIPSKPQILNEEIAKESDSKQNRELKPCTHNMNAKERWKWSYNYIHKVTWYVPNKKSKDQADTGDKLVEKKVVLPSAQKQQEFKGLPRPEDYDDFWYQAEDGLWYNEYDDQLEEGQFYEEIQEEDGYPKPDLSEVESCDDEVPETQKLEEKEKPTPKITQEKISQPTDPELKAAQDAAKAAQDTAKNLLGGAMSFGGGLLGGVTGEKPQQQQQGFGFGGLGGIMGPAKPQQQQKKEQPKPKPAMKKQPTVAEDKDPSKSQNREMKKPPKEGEIEKEECLEKKPTDDVAKEKKENNLKDNA